jgi:MFS family permease
MASMIDFSGLTSVKRLTRDALLLCFSAFFADLGYQGVAALFPLYIVLELHRPVYWYGAITGIAFGAGSLFAFVGGLAGDRYDKKYVAIAGNAFIPLMAFSGLAHDLWLSALLFILGWWARYFRTPARRALLVHVTAPEDRALAFGVLHALDIGGGMLSALCALALLALQVPVGSIMLLATLPLIVSTAVLFFVQRRILYRDETPLLGSPIASPAAAPDGRTLLILLLASATLYGFSFYNLGFPILTATHGRAGTAGYELGVLAFAIYLGVSAVSGYVLGARSSSPLRSLWLLGYLPSAIGSGLIGVSVLLHFNEIAFYLFVATLGFGMGAVETLEPTLVSSLVGSTTLSRGMGFLSISRSVGQFLSNLIMGVLFSFSQSVPYFYAFASASLATLILGAADARFGASARPSRRP